MRVLDVGSGMGDVALCPADIVGPGGRDLGIDRDAAALDNATATQTRRAAPPGSSSAGNLDEFAHDQFDTLVGRYVLLYQPDPSSTIRSLLRSVKRGGIVVSEFDLPDPDASYPPCPPTIRSACW